MTLRQRIEAVFRGERPDAMVWFGDLGYWYAAHRKIGDLPERWRGPLGIQQVHRDLNVGQYVPGCCAYRTIENPKVKVSRTERDGVAITEYQTPIGSLQQRHEYSPESFSWGYKEHPVKRAEDLRIVRYIEEGRRYEPCPEEIERIDREYADFGLPIIATRASPMGELYKSWIGVMDLSYLLADEPDEIHQTLDVMARSELSLFEITADSKCPYVMLCENFTAETMAGLFDLHSRDYLKEQIAKFHQRGKKVLCHIDGTLRGLVEKLPAIGVDCLDAVTPKPVGDVAVEDIRRLTGDDMLILGGLPGAMFAPPFAARDIEEHARKIIRLHKAGGKWMFGVADQVPPNGDIQLVKLIADLVEEFGRY